MSRYRIRAADVRPITQQDRRGVSVGDVVELPGKGVGVVERINARARTVQARAIPGATVAGIDKAANSFREFTGHKPEGVVTLPAPKRAGVAWLLGELEGVIYRAKRDGKTERYLHKFRSTDRPALAVTFDGQQLVILGGGYRVTKRGIEG